MSCMVSTLVSVQLHGVSRRSRQPCAPSCRVFRRLVSACLHSQRCVASSGAVNSVVCLANTPTRDDVPLPTAFVPPYIFKSLISC
eukprot:scaffold504_cov146-Isochrysis_galbana.AAC.1